MKVLVIRFSAMGDVTLTVPVLRDVLNNNPELEISLLTNPRFEPVFKNISRLEILPYDVNLQYKGFFGLWTLFKDLKKTNFDIVIDLHQSLRSKILLIFFQLFGTRTFKIDKGRKEKKNLIGQLNKNKIQLKHTTIRYEEVFKKSGLKTNLSDVNYTTNGIVHSNESLFKIKEFLVSKNLENKRTIGIAPFAKHPTKEWSINKIQLLINELSNDTNNVIFLFGQGIKEISQLQFFQTGRSTSILLASEYFNLEEELALMSQLNFFLCMDSANLHLSELSGCPKVVSIWGPTHSHLGFAPFFKQQKEIVEISTSELPCRPCSVFGNKPCHRGDNACMERISVDEIFKKLK